MEMAYGNEPSVELGTTELANDFIGLLAQIPERDPATFFAFTPEQLRLIFAKPDTICALIYEGDRPIAGGILWRPMPEDAEIILREHEGGEIDMETGTYLQLDNTVVLPSHRGAGLQGVVVRTLTRDVHEPVVATVSPRNPASEKTLVKCGFAKRKLVERHEGHERNVVVLEP